MRIKNSLGLSIAFLENGSVKSIEVDPIRISLKAATSFSKSGSNLYLRKRGNPCEFKAMLGPESKSDFTITDDSFMAQGTWDGIDYQCKLQLSEESLSWKWRIEITNTSGIPVELDLIYVQDIGLKQMSDGLVNEYYVSQYLERRILEDKNLGAVICCRQNMKESGGHPWLMIACNNRAVSACVDGMQFYGKTYRETGIPEGLLAESLGGEYAGESSVIALQEQPFKLDPGDHHYSIFVATCMPDHPKATSADDLEQLAGLMLEFGTPTSSPNVLHLSSAGNNLFNSAGFLPVDDLSDGDLDRFFGPDRRHREDHQDQLLSFFGEKDNHVVLRAKEILADRPHAHIMHARAGFAPDGNIVSTTSFAFGVFNSHLSQGNTNFNVFLSICNSQFNLEPESGQRIFVEIDSRKYLLGVPSAFEIGLNHCRWIYKHGHHCFQVRTWTSKAAPQVNLDFKVISGPVVKLLITHDFDQLNGWNIHPGNAVGVFVARPKQGSMIEAKFPHACFRIIVQGCQAGNHPDDIVALNPVYRENGTSIFRSFSDEALFKSCGDEVLYSDRKSRDNNLFVLDVQETSDFCMSFVGEVCVSTKAVSIENADQQWLSDSLDARAEWQNLSLNLSLEGEHDDIAAIREILPWYGMNALTHFLTPYGLEQFSGAAWGTRDISQGPFDLLLCMEKYDEARQILRIIFSNQNADGGWPQWWMFDSYSNIRADSAHGDVYYWCIIALGNYIKVTGDLKILDEILPYYQQNGADHAERTPVSEHIDRLIKMIVDSFIPGTALVPFGGGDWNDSLQPVSKELARRMISAWTVEMNYQAFNQYREVYERSGNHEKASELDDICKRTRADFNKFLIRDGIVAGYGLVEEDHSISLLLHPGDQKTNIQYSILPMNRGIISEIFTKEQAQYHQDLIEQYLKGPDGARLMNRPLRYKGGIQEIFQRAESSTFFGREIGLMYVHEHIRYAESQARTGRADEFLKALRQAIPVAYREIVPCGDIRQSNCYYSSSDVTFKSRYEADALYDEIKTGKITLKGGWRVYSSGPGIYIGLIVTRLLGLRIEFGKVILDPVIPYSLDGLSASIDFMGHPVTFTYFVEENCFSPRKISINGNPVNFSCEENKYRQGGAVIPKDEFLAKLDQQNNSIEIYL